MDPWASVARLWLAAAVLALPRLAEAATPSAPAPDPSNTAPYGYHTEYAPSPAFPGPQPAPSQEFGERPLTLEARLGLGAPTGLIGLSANYSPIPAFGFDCGAGTNEQGLQLACGLRGRLVLDSQAHFLGQTWLHAVTLTSGFSGGRYIDTRLLEHLIAADGPGPAELHFARAYWWNNDLGVEWRDGSFVARVFFGLAVLLNPNQYSVVKPTSDSFVEQPSTTLFYFGFGVGVAP